MSLLPPAQVQRRAVARVARIAADGAGPARLSYALILIVACQMLLFTCLLASFSGFLLLTFFDLNGRVSEIERQAATPPAAPAINIEVQPPSLLPTPSAIETVAPVTQPVSPLANDGAATPEEAATLAEESPMTDTADTPVFSPTATLPALPVAETPAIETPAPAQTALTDLRGVTLHVLQNSGPSELLELRNGGSEIVDVSNWRLVGSVGADNIACIIPGAVALPPGSAFQIASGNASPIIQGYKCTEAEIWDDTAETIYLTTRDGETIQVEASFVQPPTPVPETPSPTPTPDAPAPDTPTISSVTLTVLHHSGPSELVELRNVGAEVIDISGWRLYGNANPNNVCTLPAGSSLAPGAIFQVANGDVSPAAPGYSCSPTPLWDDSSTTISLADTSGQLIEVQVDPAATPTDVVTPTQASDESSMTPQGPDATATPPAVTASLHGITLAVVENSGQSELLQLHNVGTETVDISNWQLSSGSAPLDARCIIPAGSSVPPGGIFHVTSGETPLIGPGHRCATTSIWADTGETILLTASDGQRIEVPANLAPP